MEGLLQSDDELTLLIKLKGVNSWNQLLHYVRHLPYGRNKNREDLSLVTQEGRGTCSSKHALLKQIADLNGIPNVQLILGMYKMNEQNTPGIGQVLSKNGVAYIPEAHCYLKVANQNVDVTSSTSNFDRIADHLLKEVEISPHDVSQFKITFHQNYLKNWLVESKSKFSYDEIWTLREQCISNLESA